MTLPTHPAPNILLMHDFPTQLSTQMHVVDAENSVAGGCCEVLCAKTGC